MVIGADAHLFEMVVKGSLVSPLWLSLPGLLSEVPADQLQNVESLHDAPSLSGAAPILSSSLPDQTHLDATSSADGAIAGIYPVCSFLFI